MNLTDKQRKFVQIIASGEYKSKAAAARDAGYAHGSSDVAASALMRNPKIVEAIKQAKEQALSDKSSSGVPDPELSKARKLAADAAYSEARIAQIKPEDAGKQREASRKAWTETILEAHRIGAAGESADGLAARLEEWILTRT
jgi:phage terminase small subunit